MESVCTTRSTATHTRAGRKERGAARPEGARDVPERRAHAALLLAPRHERRRRVLPCANGGPTTTWAPSPSMSRRRPQAEILNAVVLWGVGRSEIFDVIDKQCHGRVFLRARDHSWTARTGQLTRRRFHGHSAPSFAHRIVAGRVAVWPQALGPAAILTYTCTLDCGLPQRGTDGASHVALDTRHSSFTFTHFLWYNCIYFLVVQLHKIIWGHSLARVKPGLRVHAPKDK